MSYEDIVEAQAKRDAKEAVVVKGKRSRPKRKALHRCQWRLKGHGKVKWKLRRMRLKQWGWRITALSGSSDEESLCTGSCKTGFTTTP
jgi:hypothetical protein